MQTITRRKALGLGAGAVLVLTVGDVRGVLATPAESDAEIAKFTGGKALEKGKIAIDLPEIAENGNTVPLSIVVDHPMTEQNYISDILVVADGNPNPGVASFKLTPLAGKAEVQLRVRMASTQKIVALAEMSDGSLWTLAREVKVTIGGCGG